MASDKFQETTDEQIAAHFGTSTEEVKATTEATDLAKLLSERPLIKEAHQLYRKNELGIQAVSMDDLRLFAEREGRQLTIEDLKSLWDIDATQKDEAGNQLTSVTCAACKQAFTPIRRRFVVREGFAKGTLRMYHDRLVESGDSICVAQAIDGHLVGFSAEDFCPGCRKPVLEQIRKNAGPGTKIYPQTRGEASTKANALNERIAARMSEKATAESNREQWLKNHTPTAALGSVARRSTAKERAKRFAESRTK